MTSDQYRAALEGYNNAVKDWFISTIIISGDILWEPITSGHWTQTGDNAKIPEIDHALSEADEDTRLQKLLGIADTGWADLLKTGIYGDSHYYEYPYN